MTKALLTELDAAGHAGRERTLLPRLHPDEQGRYRAFSAEARRQSWLAGRALLLTAVEQVAGEADAAALRTAASGGVVYGGAPVHLNLSHSGIFLAAVVSRHPVGIDIERVRPRAMAVRAERVFCRDESQALAPLQNEARLVRFFQLWTLKEAASKAAELSIWDGLGKACFDLAAGRCHLAPPFPTGPWRFIHGGFDTEWRLAVAVRGEMLDVSCLRAGPSGWNEQPLIGVQALRDD